MRIVMVSPTIGDAFGQERVMRDSSRELRARGAEVYFLGDTQAGTLPECEGFHLVPGLSALHSLSPEDRVAALHGEALDKLAGIRPDVVHLIDQFDYRLLSSITRQYPTVLTAHTVAPTCPASTRAIRGGVCERRSGWTCAAYHHRYGCLSFLKNDLRRIHAIHNYRLRRRALRGLRAIVAVSRYVEQLLARDGWEPEKIRLIFNPVTVPARPAAVPGLPRQLLIAAARLTPIKGIDRLLRALGALRDREWTLWLVGDGPERAALEALARAEGVAERVVFRGRVPYAELPALFASARAVVQPNLGPEGFGLSVAEASALGAPVVAFGVPALDEILVHGETGLLAAPDDTEDLTRQLARVLTDDAFVERCRRRGPEVIATRFGARAHADATWELYQAISTAAAAPRTRARRA